MLKLKPAQWDTLWIAFVLGLFTLPGATAGRPTALAAIITLVIAAWLRAGVQADSRRGRLIQAIVSIVILVGAMILSAGAAKDKWKLADATESNNAPVAVEKANPAKPAK